MGDLTPGDANLCRDSAQNLRTPCFQLPRNGVLSQNATYGRSC